MENKRSVLIKALVFILVVGIASMSIYFYLKSKADVKVTYRVKYYDDDESLEDEPNNEEDTDEEIEARRKEKERIFTEEMEKHIPSDEKIASIKESIEKSKEYNDYVDSLNADLVIFTRCDQSHGHYHYRYEYTGCGVFYVNTDRDGNILDIEDTTIYKKLDYLDDIPDTSDAE